MGNKSSAATAGNGVGVGTVIGAGSLQSTVVRGRELQGEFEWRVSGWTRLIGDGLRSAPFAIASVRMRVDAHISPAGITRLSICSLESVPIRARIKLSLCSDTGSASSSSSAAATTASLERDSAVFVSIAPGKGWETALYGHEMARIVEPRDAVVCRVQTTVLSDAKAESIVLDPAAAAATAENKSGALPFADLQQNIGALLTDGRFSDVVLVAADGSEFRAHRSILAARSPVFAAMLTGEMKESKERRVVLEHLSPRALAALLTYIYTGQFHQRDKAKTQSASANAADADRAVDSDNVKSWSDAAELYRAGDQYQIPSLCFTAVQELSQWLTLATLPETLQLANLHAASQPGTSAALRSLCQNCAATNIDQVCRLLAAAAAQTRGDQSKQQ